MADPEFLCVRCARHRKTCCQLSEVYATPGDVRRIALYTGLDPVGEDSFVCFTLPENPVYVVDDDPTWQEFVVRPDGMRRTLRRAANGDCVFLGPQGCTLPLDVRPLVCRIYPFDFNDQGLRRDLAPGCPLELLSPGQGLVEALEMNVADARAWHRQLYAEIRQERHDLSDVAPPPVAAAS